MYAKFSLQNIPRHKSAGCLSLRFGSLMTALVVILYSMCSVQRCVVVLSQTIQFMDFNQWASLVALSTMIAVIAIHLTSFALSAVMMLGALKEQAKMIKPWVVFKSIQLIAEVLLVLWVTVTSFHHLYNNALQIYILQFVSILVEFYMLVIVASYYKELTERNDEAERLRFIDKAWYTEV
ncbi:uncharacterized protein LOC113238215 [Hyposmocoma kahamanoa]|uniref:uncharacterized protein LOC113238215 n=1 Tax=Hyposmocoma kahamanoa TaxID=1477025 RepID=UPI000E6D7B69|nr:uncharacterized protein LOC113238215 [Hyposmocoma kahamanoa]